MMKPSTIAVGALMVLSAAGAAAHDITVQHAWARFTVEGMSMSGVFGDIKNTGRRDDVLISASTPASASSELHETVNTGGVMKMQAMPAGLPVPAGKTVHLQPGSYHIMLMKLGGPLKAGTSIPVTFRFKYHHPVTVNVPVRVGPEGTSVPAGSHEHMHNLH